MCFSQIWKAQLCKCEENCYLWESTQSNGEGLKKCGKEGNSPFYFMRDERKGLPFWIQLSTQSLEHRLSNEITLWVSSCKNQWLSRCSMYDLYWYFECMVIIKFLFLVKENRNFDKENFVLFWLIECLTFLLLYINSPLALNLFIYLFIIGCIGSLSLCAGFL